MTPRVTLLKTDSSSFTSSFPRHLPASLLLLPVSLSSSSYTLHVFIFLPLLLLLRYLDVFQPLQLGGVKELSPQRRYRGFTGCIRNLAVDSQVDTLTTRRTVSQVEKLISVRPSAAPRRWKKGRAAVKVSAWLQRT